MLTLIVSSSQRADGAQNLSTTPTATAATPSPINRGLAPRSSWARPPRSLSTAVAGPSRVLVTVQRIPRCTHQDGVGVRIRCDQPAADARVAHVGAREDHRPQ